jgi:site-specific recombinase XerD
VDSLRRPKPKAAPGEGRNESECQKAVSASQSRSSARKEAASDLRKNPFTFAQIAEDALEYSRNHKRSANDDAERMERLLEWFASEPAESLTPQQIERKLMACAREREWKAATVNRHKALLSLTYRIAVQNGKVQHNPVRLVRRLREDNTVVRYLRPEEELKLRAAVEPKHPERWAMVVFAMNTGLRVGEQRDLTWADLVLDHNPPQVRLKRTKNGSARIHSAGR